MGGASVIRYFLFDELPDSWVYAGGSLIVASGLYILHRERQVKQVD